MTSVAEPGCTENLIRVDEVMESPKLAIRCSVSFWPSWVLPFKSKLRFEAENAVLRLS
jgi:hypothetical protein